MLSQFWEHVEDQENGCQEWTRTIEKHSGYGVFRGMKAHVFSYLDSYPNEDIWDLHIHHLCENKRCVNPDHLQALTPGEHISLHKKGIKRGPDGPSDAKKALRAEYRERVIHCGKGHEFTKENTGYQMSGPYRSRYCKQCAREKARRWRTEKYVPHPKELPTHCSQGHEYDEENTKFGTRPDGSTKRYCRECNRLRAAVARKR